MWHLVDETGYGAALLDETHAFGELFLTGDPAQRVPSCPEWTLNQLLRHFGRGHRWAAQIVADRREHPLDPREVVGGKPPATAQGAVDWLNDSAQQVLHAVEQAGPDTQVWTFLGPRPASWWVRRRLHEATVHRADAALAVSGDLADFSLAPELAADGIDELLGLMPALLARNEQVRPLAEGCSIHLHATDEGLGPAGEWIISRPAGSDTLSWSHQHGHASVALRGPARDLFMTFMRRRDVADTAVTVAGDAAVWQHWVDHTAF